MPFEIKKHACTIVFLTKKVLECQSRSSADAFLEAMLKISWRKGGARTEYVILLPFALHLHSGAAVCVPAVCVRVEGGESMNNWPRGVTVSTLDSESSDRGSNPREAFAHFAPAMPS